jgi:signal recognition particle receptor subunit beta
MIFDALEKTIQLKIAYYGPALSGKTTSIKSLFMHFGKAEEVLSIESSIRRTLFFDYGTISFQNEDWTLRIHLYSCTGQDFYIVTRPITLRGIDGIIFVIDSARDAYERNLISWNELKVYFNNIIDTLPMVLAFNKQDLLNKFRPLDFMREINLKDYDNKVLKFTIAVNGENVLGCFEEVLRLIFKNLYHTEIFPEVH